MRRERRLTYQQTIESLSRHAPDLAATAVPVGLTRYWGSALGWPQAMFVGTTIREPTSLRREIGLIEDLQMMANLIQYAGKAKLLELMMEWSRFPGQALVLMAPDLQTAISSRSDAINAGNHSVRVSMRKEDRAGVIEFTLNPILGAFLPLYEEALLTFYFLLVKSFVGGVQSVDVDLSVLSFELAHSGKTLERLLPCKTRKASSVARLVIPEPLFSCANPEFDPALWSSLAGTGVHDKTAHLSGRTIGRETIEGFLRRRIMDQGRVPQVNETAQRYGLSERSLARHLENSSTSYREILNKTRMDVGTELLLHTELRIGEIAEKLDYREASAFVRSFKRQFGTSPAKWRKLVC